MTKELYTQFLNNRCTTVELNEVIHWINSGASGEDSKQLGFENWQSFRDDIIAGDDEKFRELFDKIQDRIDKKTEKERKPQSSKSALVTWMTRVTGQHVTYNAQTGKMRSTKGTVEKYIAWKEGKMVFDETPITEVAQQLKRKYNVDIEVQNDIKDYNYTVTFTDEPLMQVLELMTLASPVSNRVLPRKKLPDGSFLKQIIIIEKKIKLKPI